MASLVVEQKILGELSDSVLTTNIISQQNDATIDAIAGEEPQDTMRRMEIQNRLETKQEVLQAMKDYQELRHPLTHGENDD